MNAWSRTQSQHSPSAQSVCSVFHVENGPLLLGAHAVIFQHAGIYPCILSLDPKRWRWYDCIEDKVVVAVRTVLVTGPRCQYKETLHVLVILTNLRILAHLSGSTFYISCMRMSAPEASIPQGVSLNVALSVPSRIAATADDLLALRGTRHSRTIFYL